MDKLNNQPTDSNPLEHVVSRIDDPEYVFFDDGIEYSHSDFKDETTDDSCIYLDVSSDKWDDSKGWSKAKGVAMISKCDAIAIARKFNLTSLDLSC